LKVLQGHLGIIWGSVTEFVGGPEKDQEKSQSEWPGSAPIFKPEVAHMNEECQMRCPETCYDVLNKINDLNDKTKLILLKDSFRISQ
jgi:hypothetical protein